MTQTEYINLFKEYHEWVIYYCKNVMNLHKEDAEDITMQLFSTLWDNLINIKTSTVKTYLITSAKNKCIDHLRRTKLLNDYSKHGSHINTDDELKKIERRSLISSIHSVIETLPPKQQKIIKLTYLYDNTREEVSSALNTNQFTVRNGLHQGMTNLRNKLKKQNITI